MSVNCIPGKSVSDETSLKMQFVIAVLDPSFRPSFWPFGVAERRGGLFRSHSDIIRKKEGKGRAPLPIRSFLDLGRLVVRFVRFQSDKLITEGRCPNGFLRLSLNDRTILLFLLISVVSVG